METFEPAISFSAPHIYVSALQFAPTNSQICALFGSKFDRSLLVASGRRADWDPHLGTERILTRKLSSVSFLHNHEFYVYSRFAIVRASAGMAKNFDKIPRYNLNDEDLGAAPAFLAVTEDGAKLAFGYGNGKVGIWDCKHGGLFCDPIEEAPGTLTATFATNEILVLGSREGEVVIFEFVIQDGSSGYIPRPRMPFEKHKDAVHSLASSPDGLRLVSGSSDKLLILWGTMKGDKRHLHELHQLCGSRRSCAFRCLVCQWKVHRIRLRRLHHSHLGPGRQAVEHHSCSQ